MIVSERGEDKKRINGKAHKIPLKKQLGVTAFKKYF